MADCSPVSQFYAGRSVLVTGATGFVGKVLVEKLLRSCPAIDTVYLLIRVKKGVGADQRLQQLIDCPVFAALHESQPHVFKKLVVIGGDVSQDGLGIGDADTQLLKERVSVVFHSAARVNFDRDLKSAVDINVKGTRRVVALAHQLTHLTAMVHVSTCYLQLDKPVLQEVVYPADIEADELIRCVDANDAEWTQRIIDRVEEKTGCPVVYAASKAASEQLLADEGAGLPLAVVRPSTVTASLREPLPGWIDNMNGPTSCIAGAAKGFLRAFRADADAVTDIIPVDHCANLIIAAAYHRAQSKSSQVEVYNCASGNTNPVTWRQLLDMSVAVGQNYPIESMMWYPSISLKKSLLWHRVDQLLYHTVPAYFIDALARVTRAKPTAVRHYEKAHRLMGILDYYATRQWLFTDTKVKALMESLTAEDRETFDFDIGRVSWPSYFGTYFLGVRKYIFKEDLASVPAAKRKLSRLLVLRSVVHLALMGLLFLFFLFMMRCCEQLWSLGATDTQSLPTGESSIYVAFTGETYQKR